jgi:hypothetical protein
MWGYAEGISVATENLKPHELNVIEITWMSTALRAKQRPPNAI